MPTSPAVPIPVTFRPRRGRFRPLSAASSNAFVSKLNSSGSALVYSTYLGGSYTMCGGGIALDSSGNAYVTGLNGFQRFSDHGGGVSDHFRAASVMRS